MKQRKGLAVAMLWALAMPAAASGPQELEALRGAWSTIAEWSDGGGGGPAVFQKPVGEALAGIKRGGKQQQLQKPSQWQH